MSRRAKIPYNKLAYRCDRFDKLRYKDRKMADDALRRIKTERRFALERGETVIHLERRPYKCPSCRGWHLTKQEERANTIN